MVFNNLKRKIKDSSRFKEIINILFQGELKVLVEDLHLHKHVSPKTRLKMTNSKPKIVVKTLEKLGPTFVKLGQLLSMRPDLIPAEYIEELKKLQDNSLPVTFQAIKDVVQRELNKPLSKIFSKFDEKPIAATIIGQVHLATLRSSNKRVAVKVQKPGVEQLIAKDTDILEYLAKKIDKSKKYPFLNAYEIIEEFKEYTKKELDMRVEASRMKKFYNFYDKNEDSRVIIPKIYEEFCTSKVLVMKDIKGTPLTDMTSLKRRKVNLKDLAIIGVEAVMNQVFELGMFHVDIRPDNLMLVRTKTKKNKIVDKLAFLDYDMIGIIDNEMKTHFLKMLEGLTNQNYNKIVESLLKLGEKKRKFNKDLLRKKIKKILNNRKGSSPKEEELSSNLYKIILEAEKTGFKVDKNIFLLAKSYLIIKNTANYLYPKLNLSFEIKKYFSKHKDLIHDNLIRDSEDTIMSFADFARKVPIYASEAAHLLEQEELKTDLGDFKIKKVISKYDLEVNKKTLGTTSAALFIGSLILALMRPDISFLNIQLYELGFIMFFITLFLLGVFVIKTHKYLNE